jgi:outer membrane protein assembly factor BamD (BamD/ComL family)
MAIEYLSNYLKNPVTGGEVNATNARYNLGHAYLQKENYRQALSYFEQIARSVNSNSSSVEQDAYVRSADAYFMNRNYSQAQSMYRNVMNSNLPSADYALYQTAIIVHLKRSASYKISSSVIQHRR